MLHKSRKYTITINEVDTELSISPDGWKDDDVEFQYSEEFGTFGRSIILQTLIFHREGAELLKALYDVNSVDSEAKLSVQYLTENYGYSLYYTGDFDFTTYSYDAKKEAVSIEIIDSSDIAILENRKTKNITTARTTSINGDSIPSIDVKTMLIKKADLNKQLKLTTGFNTTLEVNDSSSTEVDINLNNTTSSISYSGDFAVALASPITNIYRFYTTGSISGTTPTIKAYPLYNRFVRPQASYSATAYAYIKVKVQVLFNYTVSSSNVIYDIIVRTYKRSSTGVLTLLEEFKQEDLEFSVGSANYSFYSYGYTEEYPVLPTEEIVIECAAIKKNTGGSIVITSMNQYVSVTERGGITKELPKELIFGPTTESVINNDFGDTVTLPDGDEVILYKSAEPYKENVNIYMSGDINYTVEGIGYDNILGFARGYVYHRDSEGNQKHRERVFFKYITDLEDDVITIENVDEVWPLETGDSITLAYEFEVSIADVTLLISLNLNSDDNILIFQNSSPEDSEASCVYYQDMLSHIINATVGENKIIINPRLNLNSGEKSLYNLMLTRGALLRGFPISDRSISADFQTLWHTLKNLFGLGMYYDKTAGAFIINYLNDIYEKPTNLEGVFDIGEVSNYKESPMIDIIWNNITAGDGNSGDLEDFYLANSAHNETSYSTKTKNASVSIDLLTENVSISSVDIEITRRYSYDETKSLALDNDNTLFLVKCTDAISDIYQMEVAGDRYDLESAPEVFADGNLCLAPRNVIENNKSILLSGIPVSNDIRFLSSKYKLSPEVRYNTGTSVLTEQSDFTYTVSDVNNNAIFEPIKIEFDALITPELIQALEQNPNRIIKGWNNGEAFYCYGRQIGGSSFDRNTSFEMIKCNINRTL